MQYDDRGASQPQYAKIKGGAIPTPDQDAYVYKQERLGTPVNETQQRLSEIIIRRREQHFDAILRAYAELSNLIELAGFDGFTITTLMRTEGLSANPTERSIPHVSEIEFNMEYHPPC